MNFLRVVSVGLAMFAMFFGSGNLVFPLVLGRQVGDQAWYAMLGFFLTAAVVPIIGVIATVLYDGDYRKFLGRMGAIPGALIAMLCLALIGPFGIIPRCITVAYASTKWYMPGVSLFVFSIIAAIILGLCTLRPTKVVELLGRFLGPLKLLLLAIFVIQGLLLITTPLHTGYTPGQSLIEGLFMGYGTLDLIGAIFFSGLILTSLRHAIGASVTHKHLLRAAVQAGVMGALLLGIVYAGFVAIAAFHGNKVWDAGPAEIFSVLSMLLLGNYAGALANATVALATMTTAIALTTVFAQYLSNDIFAKKVRYEGALLITLIITIIFTNLGFAGIMQILGPIVEICYPALIVLSILNIAYKLFDFKPVKVPVYATLAGTIVIKFFSW